jgi:hypothetical protein
LRRGKKRVTQNTVFAIDFPYYFCYYPAQVTQPARDEEDARQAEKTGLSPGAGAENADALSGAGK